MKVCPKCFEKHDKPGTFCSRKCANSRGKRTEEFKEKVREKLTKPRETSTCKFCGESFVQKKSHNSSLFCGRSCQAKHNNKIHRLNGISEETKRKISVSRKAMFEKGILNQTGGNTQWIEYKQIKVQGTYELRTCIVLDRWKEQGLIKDWEYTRDRVSYVNSEGATATYLLDFKVHLKDNTFVYIETKGFVRENDWLKWEAVKNNSMVLAVWYESDICEAENSSSLEDIEILLKQR